MRRGGQIVPQSVRVNKGQLHTKAGAAGSSIRAPQTSTCEPLGSWLTGGGGDGRTQRHLDNIGRRVAALIAATTLSRSRCCGGQCTAAVQARPANGRFAEFAQTGRVRQERSLLCRKRYQHAGRPWGAPRSCQPRAPHPGGIPQGLQPAAVAGEGLPPAGQPPVLCLVSVGHELQGHLRAVPGGRSSNLS